MKSNLHTHTSFSDGSDLPEKYVEEAVRQGFSVLGFSDHSPVPFENGFAIREERLQEYVDAIQRLKHPSPAGRGGNGGGVLLGLEIDYIPGMTLPFSFYRKKYPFDYLIGSVHLVRNGLPESLWFIDGPRIERYDRGLKEIFGGDARKAVTAYYRQLIRMIHEEKPDIVGHLDKVKMYNRGRYFSEEEPWYRDLVRETLNAIRDAGCVIEVNTRGLYKKRSDSLFPGPAILKQVLSMRIPVTITSDAHKPEELSNGLAEATLFLKGLGFREQWVLTGKEWSPVLL